MHYLIEWDAIEAGVIKKIDHQWIAEDVALVDFVKEIGQFIDHHEAQLKKE